MTALAELLVELAHVERQLAGPTTLLAELDALDQAVRDAEDVAARRLPPGARRRLFDHERAAGVLFADVDAAQDRTADRLAALVEDLRARYARALATAAGQLPAAQLARELDRLDDPTVSSALALDARERAGADRTQAQLVEVLLAHRTAAARRLAGERAAQGRPPTREVPPPGQAETDLAAERAGRLIRDALATVDAAAARFAVTATGTQLAEDDEDLVGRLRRELAAAAAVGERTRKADARAAAQQTEATTRVVLAPQLGAISNVYASELLDRNTCPPCAGVDGRDYPTLDAARVDYPLGTYRDCEGGARCRGTLVIVWATESPATRGGPPPGATPPPPPRPRDDGPPLALDPTIVPRPPAPAPVAALPADLTALTDDELADLVADFGDDEDALARVFAELDRRDELASAPPPAAVPEAADAAAELRRRLQAAYDDEDYDLASQLGRELDELEGADESWAPLEQAAPDGLDADTFRQFDDLADRYLESIGVRIDPAEQARARAARAEAKATRAARPAGRLRDRLTAEWQELQQHLYIAAENATNGYVYNKRRDAELRAKYGDTPSETYLLYSLPIHVSGYYASEELLRYWSEDPLGRRPTLAQYLRAGGVRDRKTLAAAAAADGAFAGFLTKDRRRRPKRQR